LGASSERLEKLDNIHAITSRALHKVTIKCAAELHMQIDALTRESKFD